MVYTITPLLHADIIITTTTVHSLVGIILFLLLFGEGISCLSKSLFLGGLFNFSISSIFFWSEIDKIDDG